MKIDLGCGIRKQPGYIGIDRLQLPGVDIVCDFEKRIDLLTYSVDEVHANMVLEHVQDLPTVFEEIYRVCKRGALVSVTVPYFQSVTQYKDPTHKSMIMPEMMRYFSGETWYGSDYGFKCNFRLVKTDYFYLPPFDRINKWLPFFRPFLWIARRYLWNVVHSIKMTLEVQ